MGSSKVEPRLVTVNLFFTQSKSMIYGMEQIQKLESYVAKYPAIDQMLVSLEQKTKVKKIYLLYGIVATVITWLMFGYGAQLLCNAIGFAYPAYCSVKALESSKKDDDTQWLVYWVVFAMFSVLEFFSDILVGWFHSIVRQMCLFGLVDEPIGRILCDLQ